MLDEVIDAADGGVFADVVIIVPPLCLVCTFDCCVVFLCHISDPFLMDQEDVGDP